MLGVFSHTPMTAVKPEENWHSFETGLRRNNSRQIRFTNKIKQTRARLFVWFGDVVCAFQPLVTSEDFCSEVSLEAEEEAKILEELKHPHIESWPESPVHFVSIELECTVLSTTVILYIHSIRSKYITEDYSIILSIIRSII